MNSSQKNKKIVIITSRFPYPLEKGDKLRAFHQIKVLSKSFDIHLISLHEEQISQKQLDALNPYCKSIHPFYLSFLLKWLFAGVQIFGNKPFQTGYFYNPFIKYRISKLLKKTQPDHIYCQLIRASEYVKDYHDCSKTIDYMDALSKGIERRIAGSKFLKKIILKKEYNRLLIYENAIFEYFENHTIISEEDRNQIFHKDFSKIQVVKNGVDELFFENLYVEKKYDLVFTGNMSYPPNIRAAKYLVNEVLPLCESKLKICISGANPSKEVLALESNNISVTGWVDDIRLSYAASRIFIAPMTIGTGLQNKLLEAMAMQLPCVTTSLANKSLGALNNEHVLIGDLPKELANQIDRLIQDAELANELSSSGRHFVRNNFDWLSVTEPLIRLLNN